MVDKFEEVWQALVEHGSSPRNRDAVKRYWDTLTEEQQDCAYRNIPRKVREDKFVQYDPIKAIRENIRKYQAVEPINYNGNKAIDSVAKTTLLVSAWHNGRTGIYTLTDATEHGMTINYGFNFDYEAYKAERMKKLMN